MQEAPVRKMSRTERPALTKEYVFYGQPLVISVKQFFHRPDSLRSNVLGSGARGQVFKFWAGQIEHRVANGSPPLWLFFKRSCVAPAQCCGEGPRKLVAHGVIQRVRKDLIFLKVIIPVDSFTERVISATTTQIRDLIVVQRIKLPKILFSKWAKLSFWKVPNNGT